MAGNEDFVLPSGGPELKHALGQFGPEAARDQHVIDMGDQFAGGKAHLVRVQNVLVEYDRHQFLGGFRGLAAGIRDQPAAFLVVIGQLLDAVFNP